MPFATNHERSRRTSVVISVGNVCIGFTRTPQWVVRLYVAFAGRVSRVNFTKSIFYIQPVVYVRVTRAKGQRGETVRRKWFAREFRGKNDRTESAARSSYVCCARARANTCTFGDRLT